MLAHPPTNSEATITGRSANRAANLERIALAPLGWKYLSAVVSVDFTVAKSLAVWSEAASVRSEVDGEPVAK